MAIILFRGRPGSGKTTFAKALAARTNFAYLAKDDLYDVIATYIPTHEDRNAACYNFLYHWLKAQSNPTIILDFPFQHVGDTELIRTFCTENNIAIQTILVTCSKPGLWKQRLLARSINPKPNQLITSYEEFEDLYGTMSLEPEAGELVIDSALDFESELDRIETALDLKY